MCWKPTSRKSRVSSSRDGHGIVGTRFGLHRQDGFEFLQRDFGLAIGIDHIAQFLQGSEDEEGVNEQRNIIANRQTVGEDQIHHQELNAGPQEVDEGALNETQAAQIADLFELQLRIFVGGGLRRPIS